MSGTVHDMGHGIRVYSTPRHVMSQTMARLYRDYLTGRDQVARDTATANRAIARCWRRLAWWIA